MERTVRSQGYQYLIVECLVGDTVWNSFTNQDAIAFCLNPWKYDERLVNLQDQLKDETWKMAAEICTERQWLCLTMYCQGMTQCEIAKALGVNQSSVVKSLKGNVDYRNGKKTYGGITKKLKKAAEKNEVIQAILAQITEIQEEKL